MGADQDEARARATLAEMQAKLARGPHDALGITQVASFDEIRGAFLQLTKVYHPARFARMASELQKLSNEVFLGIKGAHDSLVKALGPSPRANRSSQMPPFRVTGSGPNQVVDAPAQPAKTPATKATQTMPAIAQPPGRPTPLPPNVVPSQPTQPITMRPLTPSGARPATPPRAPTPAMGVPVKSTQPMPTMARTKTGQTAVLPTQITPPAPLSARPGTPPQRPVTPTNPTHRAPTNAGPAPAAAAFDEKAVLRTVAEHVKAGRWSDATVALQQLAAKAPTKENRAMLSYARAREAQAAGLIDDAIHELKRALEINPGLVPAKTALAELQTRRK